MLQATDFLYEGKAKKVFATTEPDKVIIAYKDDATAFNAQKKGTITDKGVYNNAISAQLFQHLIKEGIPTHFIEKIDDRQTLCYKVDIIPIEFIVRNIITGSMAKRLDIPDGTIPPNTILDICYKRDDLGDPLINDHHAVALGITTYEELQELYSITLKINIILKEIFRKEDILLVDFKIEFGRKPDGTLVLADEISPDTCRFWDVHTKQRLDKDRFRLNLGNEDEGYKEIFKRLND